MSSLMQRAVWNLKHMSTARMISHQPQTPSTHPLLFSSLHFYFLFSFLKSSNENKRHEKAFQSRFFKIHTSLSFYSGEKHSGLSHFSRALGRRRINTDILTVCAGIFVQKNMCCVLTPSITSSSSSSHRPRRSSNQHVQYVDGEQSTLLFILTTISQPKWIINITIVVTHLFSNNLPS